MKDRDFRKNKKRNKKKYQFWSSYEYEIPIINISSRLKRENEPYICSSNVNNNYIF